LNVNTSIRRCCLANRESRRLGTQTVQCVDELNRPGNSEVCIERSAIPPLLVEEKSQWLLHIAVHAVCQASRFEPRPRHVRHAFPNDVIECLWSRDDAPRHDDDVCAHTRIMPDCAPTCERRAAVMRSGSVGAMLPLCCLETTFDGRLPSCSTAETRPRRHV